MSVENISRRAAAPSPKTDEALGALSALVAAEMSQVNGLILAKMQSRVSLIPDLAKYLIAAGGKRLRPMLTLACCKLYGGNMPRATELATCVEFIHTATLLHDDVVDESYMRRGRPSANSVFGNEAAVLVGDFLFTRAFELMVADGDLNVLRVLSSAASTIAEGEVHQLLTSHNLNTSFDTYYDVVGAKTAALFAAACEVGGMAASLGADDCSKLRALGSEIGIASQIADDVLDYSAHQATLGKSIGDDFKEGKLTLPVLFALEHASEAEQKFWQRTLADDKQEDEDLAQAQAYMLKHNALQKAMAVAEAHTAKALELLSTMPQNEVTSALHSTIHFITARDY